MIWVIVGVAVIVAGIAIAVIGRKHPQDQGVASFKRHIDALSPEARREVQNRVRPQTRREDDR